MYLPTSQACDAPNSLQNDPLGDLAAGAASAASTAASMDAGQQAFASLLTRAAGDFAALGPMVQKDVQVVNAATGPSRDGILTGNAPEGGGTCDLGQGGCTVLPLNGPGVALPLTARPADLTTTQSPLPGPPGQPGGLGAVRVARRRRRGMGACCSDFPAWGDPFPSGMPSPSPVASAVSWIGQNPWLSAALAVGGVLLLAQSGKGARRG